MENSEGSYVEYYFSKDAIVWVSFPNPEHKYLIQVTKDKYGNICSDNIRLKKIVAQIHSNVTIDDVFKEINKSAHKLAGENSTRNIEFEFNLTDKLDG